MWSTGDEQSGENMCNLKLRARRLLSCTCEKIPNWMYPVVLVPKRPCIHRTFKVVFYTIIFSFRFPHPNVKITSSNVYNWWFWLDKTEWSDRVTDYIKGGTNLKLCQNFLIDLRLTIS